MKLGWQAVKILALAAAIVPAANADYWVLIGTYTGKGSKGIYAYRLNTDTGGLKEGGLAAEERNPSFLAVHPNDRFVYAVSETDEGGAVSAFALDRAAGKLKLLNRVSSRGKGPCHVSVDKTGKVVLIANYTGGSVTAFPVKEDGSLGEATAFIQHKGSSVDKSRQEGPHAHSINVSPDNRFAMAADLGLDKVLIYRLDATTATLTPHDPPYARVDAGSGPRHFAFHPGGRAAYVINEMASTITSFVYDAERGALSGAVQTISTLPEGFKGENWTAEVVVHPSGRFVYGSNRGHDSIAVFAVEDGDITLKTVDRTPSQGKWPRNFGIDPTGKFLIAANQNSNNVVVFRIDGKTGKLTPTGQEMKVSMPVCVRFAKAD